MSFISLFLIALSLATDAFAVSISAGIVTKKILLHRAVLLATTFGIFQAVMPLIGWVGGYSLRSYIEPIDHWIAFILLGLIGINMIREALGDDEEESRDYFSLRSLLTLGIATSIDAFAIGISFALLPIDILYAVSLIGVVTFLLCFSGVYLWSRFGHIFERNAEILGGSILIIIGFKILLEHLFLS